MERLYCVNCLRQTPAYPCPLCGYDPGAAPVVHHAHLAQKLQNTRCILGLRETDFHNDSSKIYSGVIVSKNQSCL